MKRLLLVPLLLGLAVWRPGNPDPAVITVLTRTADSLLTRAITADCGSDQTTGTYTGVTCRLTWLIGSVVVRSTLKASGEGVADTLRWRALAAGVKIRVRLRACQGGACSKTITSSFIVPTSGTGTPVAPLTLTSLRLTPKPVAVLVSDTTRFTASATWSNGTTTLPVPKTWSATGGTIDTTGKYTAHDTAGTYRVIVSGGGKADTAVVTVQAAGQAPGTLYPNQPAGYTRIAEHNFSAIPSGSNGLFGAWAYDGSANMAITTMAADSAQSPRSVLQFTYSAGLQAGYGPGGDFFGWISTVSVPSAPEYSSIYESLYFQIVGTSFETQAWGVKLLGYWGVGQKYTWPGGVPNQIFSRIVNGDSTRIMSSWKFQILGQNHIDWTRAQNSDTTARITAGPWHHFEAVMTLNTAADTNGVLKVWIDGHQLMNYSNVLYRTLAAASGFYGRDYHPIWGGAGGRVRSREDRLRLDHLYLSGIVCGAPSCP